jgi:hypothetical protein
VVGIGIDDQIEAWMHLVAVLPRRHDADALPGLARHGRVGTAKYEMAHLLR